jgi:tRNA dimethylallyltransferase
VRVLAIFGPTAVGKTGVAIAVAERLREAGEDPVAVSCDALQVYRGLEPLTGAPSAAERERLEHRLVGIAEVGEEFSAGRFAELAHREIDGLLGEGRRPIVVGGTGLYLQAALRELDLRPPVPAAIRAEVEAEIAQSGPEHAHAGLSPEVAASIHPRDRKRVARAVELQRAGIEPPTDSAGLWGARLRHPTTLVGITASPQELRERVERRFDALVAGGAEEAARRAAAAGASRTARAALGFEQLLSGDLNGALRAHLAYARRQLTWMRKLREAVVMDRTGRDDGDVALKIAARLGD